MASLDDPGEVREGFLCPLCLKDLQSFYQLQSHYEEEHSGEDHDVKGQIKSKRLGFPAYLVLSLGALTRGMVFISSRGCHCQLKKDVRLESCELSFIWEQNADCSPGGSLSDGSGRLLRSRSEGKSVYKVLVKAECTALKHSICDRCFVSMRV